MSDVSPLELEISIVFSIRVYYVFFSVGLVVLPAQVTMSLISHESQRRNVDDAFLF